MTGAPYVLGNWVRYAWPAGYRALGVVGALGMVRLVRFVCSVHYGWYAGYGSLSAVPSM